MFTAPKNAPLIIGVTFNVARSDRMSPVLESTCWREVGLKGVALTDTTLDWNRQFQQIAGNPSVTSATATVVFTHTLRVCLPIPPAGKGAALQSLGALVKLIVEMMSASGEFIDATPANHLILYVATLAGISFASPSRGNGRKRALDSNQSQVEPRPPTEKEWRQELKRQLEQELKRQQELKLKQELERATSSKRSHVEPRPLTETERRREKERERKRLYYLANKERLLSNSLRYKRNNPDKVREHTRNYNEKHREELNAKASDYYEKNKEAINRRHRARYAKKVHAIEHG